MWPFHTTHTKRDKKRNKKNKKERKGKKEKEKDNYLKKWLFFFLRNDLTMLNCIITLNRPKERSLELFNATTIFNNMIFVTKLIFTSNSICYDFAYQLIQFEKSVGCICTINVYVDNKQMQKEKSRECQYT